MEEDKGAATVASTVSFLLMPHEVWAGVVWNLAVPDLGRAAATCTLFSQEAADAELWFHIFMRSCWPPSPALLAFAEGTSSAAGVDWRARLRARAAAEPAIVVDVGRGYSKFTVVHGIHGRWEIDGSPPQLVQLCSSPTHPPDCDRNQQLRYMHAKLDRELLQAAANPAHRLHRTALAPDGTQPRVSNFAVLQGLQARPELNGACVCLRAFHAESERWSTELVCLPVHGGDTENVNGLLFKRESLALVRRAQDLPILIGEPFATTAGRGAGDAQSHALRSWDASIRAQLGNDRPGAVHVVSQAQMALWAHGIDHGIVVNIGQGQTFAMPVVNGEVVPACVGVSDMGSGDLTQQMMGLLGRKYPFVNSSLMTWCRDMKEQHCYVSPPAPHGRGGLRARLSAGDDFGVRSVEVEVPGGRSRGGDEGLSVDLAEERVLVPELLFETQHGCPSLPQLIVGCAERTRARGRCDEEGVRNLLRQVVLVGGAADFPGIRPRTEFEIRRLLREEPCFAKLAGALASPDDAFVLNPPLGEHGPLSSPRFVPLFGGCVRAASSAGYGKWHGDDAVVLRSLPLEEEEESVPGNPRGIRNWVRRRLLNLNGPSIFRTGGGGGEDDQVWRMLMEDEDGSAMQSSDEEEEPHEQDSDDDDTDSEESCPEAQSPGQASGARTGSEQADQAEAQNAASSTSAAAASSAAPGRGASQRAGQGRGSTGGPRGKGKGGKGKGKGKGKVAGARTWRPVRT